jgi:site-specific DNA-methyltransferase (adenine-specific)
MACAIEDAGFEIRDQIGWAYGTGFPKSLDVSKAIDKAAGAEREVIGVAGKSGSARSCMAGDFAGGEYMATAPATEAARQWQGWGTALKPAWEPIVVARKPLIGTVAENVLAHGTGGLNIDGCRIETADNLNGGAYAKTSDKNAADASSFAMGAAAGEFVQPTGRWPANLIHDGSDEVLSLFPNGAARFFYCSKASRADRGKGNTHQTVKPTDLMRYLCRLVTPPGGLVLDPFTGSGSTGKAAILEGFQFIGFEKDPEHAETARRRMQP